MVVVDLLEMIQVDHHQRQRVIVPIAKGHLPLQELVHRSAVVQAGQGIRHRLHFRLGQKMQGRQDGLGAVDIGLSQLPRFFRPFRSRRQQHVNDRLHFAADIERDAVGRMVRAEASGCDSMEHRTGDPSGPKHAREVLPEARAKWRHPIQPAGRRPPDFQATPCGVERMERPQVRSSGSPNRTAPVRCEGNG